MAKLRFTQKDCKEFLQDLKLEELTKEFIVKGIAHCIKNKVGHMDVVMTKVYDQLSTQFGDEPKVIKGIIHKAIKELDEAAIFGKFNYEGNLTNRKLFILLLERYGY